VVIVGHAPVRSSEVLIGSRTLRDLGLHVGDEVSVGFAGTTRPFRIVGRGTLPTSGGGTGLGEGAAMTFAGMRRVVPRSVENVVLLRLRPGNDIERWCAAGPHSPGWVCTCRRSPPTS
jgi:hypothetical protein